MVARSPTSTENQFQPSGSGLVTIEHPVGAALAWSLDSRQLLSGAASYIAEESSQKRDHSEVAVPMVTLVVTLGLFPRVQRRRLSGDGAIVLPD